MDTILSLIERSVRNFPDKPALRQKRLGHWKETSYARLWETSDQIAAGLLQQGVKPGEHLAILAPSSPSWVATYLAILKASAVVVPVDKDLKDSELRHVLGHSDSRILFTTEQYLETILEIRGALPLLEKIVILPPQGECSAPGHRDQELQLVLDDWQDLLQELQVPTQQAAKLETIVERIHALSAKENAPKKSIKTGKPLFSPLLKFKRSLEKPEFLLRLDQLSGDQPPALPCPEPGQCAAILYTSGTTGRSKGAMLSQNNILSNIQAAVEAYQLDERMHTLSFLPINHVFEQVLGILLPLSLGGTVSFAESIKKIADNLSEVKPSFLLAVPDLYRRIFDRISKGIQEKSIANLLFHLPLTRDIVTRKIRSSLGAGTIFISGGAALDPTVALGLRRFGLQIYQGYGITETSPVISAEIPNLSRAGTVGKPFRDIEVKILSPDAQGEGEIAARGPNVMQGYYKDETATREVLKDGWYHTGDLGRIDEEGFLHICGRVKNLIVTPNGKNVYPEEIEEALLKSLLIAEVMVYGHREGTSEEVYAIIYPDPEEVDRRTPTERSSGLSRHELEAMVRAEVNAICRKMADYKRVRKFSLRDDEFPKTTTRKIKRYVVERDVPA